MWAGSRDFQRRSGHLCGSVNQSLHMEVKPKIFKMTGMGERARGNAQKLLWVCEGRKGFKNSITSPYFSACLILHDHKATLVIKG